MTYNGPFDVTGTLRIGASTYTGISSLATRNVSNLSLNFNLGAGLPQWQINASLNGGLGNTQYSAQYGTGSGYHLPCGYNNPNCSGGGYRPPVQGGPYPSPYPPPQQPPYHGGGGQCNIPAGDYTVATVQSGNYTTQSNYYGLMESFTGLKIRFTSGATVVEATFSNNTVTPATSGTSTSHVFRGLMTINTVNNQQCNQQIQFY